MSGIEQINQIASRLIEAGAKAVYISDLDGFEICFVGDEKFRNVLIILPSIRTWLLYKLEMEFMMDLKSKYNISLRCDNIPIIQVRFRIDDMDCVYLGYRGLSVTSVYPPKSNIPLSLIIETLRDIKSVLDGASSISKSEIVELLKKEILEARKSLSIGDKENLIASLSKVKFYLSNMNTKSLNIFTEYIDKLLGSLRSRELTADMQLKIKRSLLLMFRSILKNLEGEI
ncbi:MAG: hypothetical protein Q6363_006840 [Candidatus Njordarchaeota archaeon]